MTVIKLFDKVKFSKPDGVMHYGEVISCSNNKGRCLVSKYGPPVLIQNIKKISEDEYATALRDLQNAKP
jgi:hypothetical protein